jgi:hypothetical protein
MSQESWDIEVTEVERLRILSNKSSDVEDLNVPKVLEQGDRPKQDV